MKSGLEGRNNMASSRLGPVTRCSRLNEVRPRGPEQYAFLRLGQARDLSVSMKSGLEGRNNEAYGFS